MLKIIIAYFIGYKCSFTLLSLEFDENQNDDQNTALYVISISIWLKTRVSVTVNHSNQCGYEITGLVMKVRGKTNVNHKLFNFL